jgi:phenylpropionate dioxygenase-like ring-hydroxylating dioxygenase large terminal subunit
VIPQDGPSGNAKASPRACATPYATAVAQGMLFVRPGGTGPPPPLPLVPELDDPAFICIDIARDLPYDYATLLENVLDGACPRNGYPRPACAC